MRILCLYGKKIEIGDQRVGLPTLRVFTKKGRKLYRGSSLYFSDPLSQEDKEYLRVLLERVE